MPNSNNPIVAQPNRLWSNPYAPPSEFEKGLAGFADEMQALGGGVAGMAGQAGMEVLPQIAQPYAKDLRDWGLDTYRENIAESQAGWQAPKVARIEDIKLGEEGGVGRLGDWATYHGTKGLATLAGLALSGGAGGAAAKIATKRVVKDMAKRQASKLAKRPVKEELEKGFQREAKAALQRRGQAISKEAVEGIGEGALAQVQRNVTRGAIAGGTAGAFGLEGGGAFGQQVEGGVAPEDALLPSAGVGLVNAALEMVAPVQVAKKLGLGQWASRGLAKHIKTDKTLAKKAQRIAGKMLKGATTTAAQEGITEGIQELVQIAGERIAKDEELLAELDPEQRSQIMNAAAAGGLTGGLFGGATGPFMQGPMDARSQVVRALPPEVQQLVTNETTVSDPVEGETQEQYVARVAREVVGETAEKAAQKAAETQAAPKEGVPSTKVGAPGPESEGVPSAGDVEGPLPVALTYAEWLEQTKQRDAASVTPEETGTLYAEYQAYKEGVQNAQAVREDEGGLPPTGQVGEGVQDERREGREFVAEEGGQAAGQVSPEEKLVGDVVVGDIVTPANSEDANIVPAGKVVKVSKDGMVQVEGNKAWFPKGLFNTDRGDTLESRGEPVVKSVQQVEDDTIKELGEGWLNRAKKTGLLEIRDEAGPDGLSAEFSPTTGKITVYAKSLTEGSSVAQVLHETSHATMEMLTQGREMEFAQEIAQRKGDLEQRAGHMAELSRIGWLARELEIKHNLWNTQGKEFETEYARVEEEIAAGKKKLTKEEAAKLERDAAQVGATETVAYYAQYAHDKGVGGGLFRRIINAIKAGWMLSDVGRALGKVGLKPKISDGMAVELARRSSRYAVELREEMDRLVGEGKPEATVGAPTVVEEGEPALESREPLLDQIDQALRSEQPALDRMAGALDAARKVENKLGSMPERQIETPSFKRWFKDSKITDEAGLPLVVYHGTKRDFTEFKSVYPDGLTFFTTSSEFAEKWPEGTGGLREPATDVPGFVEEMRQREKELYTEIMQPDYDFKTQESKDAYDADRKRLGAQMVKEFGFRSPWDFETKAGIRTMPVYLSIQNPFDPRVDGELMADFLRKNVSSELVDKGAHRAGNWVIYESKEVIDELKRRGYDGIYLAENIGGPHETIAPFSNTQIKSAVGNIGAFDPTDPNILASMPETFSSAWITNPLSTAPEEVNNPGFLNRLKTNYVEKFNDLWQMSKESATKFNLARSKRAAFQKDFEDEFIKPWIDIAGKLMKEMSGQDGEFTLEDANDSFAAWHIVNDNVNELLAMKNSNEEAIRLEKTLQEYEGTLEENDPRRAEVRAVRRALQKGRRNLLSGKTWEGDTPMSADGTTTRTLTGMEVQSKLKREVDTAYDAAVGDTKIWKLSEIQDLRMDWEMLKHHGAGFATPETMSSDPEVQQRVNELLDATGRPKDAREVLARVQDNDTFQGLTQRAKDVAHMTREQLVRGGLITREEANAMANQYKHWVPLRRSAFNMQHAVDAYFGRGELGKGAKIRTGTSEVNEPVHTMQNLMASYDAAVTSAEANIARDFLAQQIEANPQHWDGWFKVKKDPDVKKSYVKYGFVHTRQSGAGEEDIPFFRDGERYYIEVDDANQRAKTLSVAIRNLDSQELGPVFNVMNKVNSWIRWVNISASPAFLLMNAPRDYFTARLNLKATEIADYGKDVRKEMRSSLRDLRKHFMQGERVDEILDWERAGGRISFVQSLRPNDESWGSIEAKIRHRQGDFNFGPGMEANFGPGVGEAVGRGRDLLEKMETINIIAENVMRYSVWKVAKNRGLSDDKAAMLSKDVTTNFDRRGLRAQTLGVYWLFYNATVQGNTQVLRNVFYGPNKKKLWAALGSVMATAFLNDQIGALTSDDEDKDGRSDWDSRPEWKRDKFASIAGSNLLWPGDESTYATVPLPWVFNTIWRFGEMASEVVRGKKDPLDVPADMAGLMIGTFNPIGGGDASLAQMAAPTAADPLVQIWENTSAFGRPLGPTRFPGQDFLPDAEMSWLNTPKGYKWLAREVNQITGGSPAEQGLVDWRPSTYKVLADTLMGGGGRFMAQLGRSAMSPLMGELPKLKDAPGLRTFFFAPGDPIEAQLYHERMAKVEQAKKAEKTFRQGPLRDLMELQRVRSEYAGELRMVSMSKDIERQIKDLRSQLRAAQVRNQESRGETLKNRIEKAQERFNKSWARRVGN